MENLTECHDVCLTLGQFLRVYNLRFGSGALLCVATVARVWTSSMKPENNASHQHMRPECQVSRVGGSKPKASRCELAVPFTPAFLPSLAAGERSTEIILEPECPFGHQNLPMYCKTYKINTGQFFSEQRKFKNNKYFIFLQHNTHTKSIHK